MRIGLRLTAGLLVIAGLVGLVGAVSGPANRTVQRELERLSRSAIVKQVYATQILIALDRRYVAMLTLLCDEVDQGVNAGAIPGRENRGDADADMRTQWSLIEQRFEGARQAVRSFARWAAENGQPETAERQETFHLTALNKFGDELETHHRLSEQFRALLADDRQAAAIWLETQLTPHYREVLLPLLEDQRLIAETEFTRGIRTAQREMAVTAQRQTQLTIVAASCAVILGLALARSIARPLGKLRLAAERIAAGRLDTRAGVQSRDEIGMLSRTFDRMAAELQEKTVSKAYVDNILQSMQEMLLVTDREGRIRQVNPAVERELGYAAHDLNGQTVASLLGDRRGDFQAVPPSPPQLGMVRRYLNFQRREGDLLPTLCSFATLHGPSGEHEGWVCVALNIADRVESEQQLRESLAEKELLLKEIHHRVKNNLQIISSLLNLQVQGCHDPDVVHRLGESQRRIRSMALIHEQLYQSEDLARIDFAEYVRRLANHLNSSLALPAQRIALNVDISDVLVPLDAAIPCGMIVNELVSNAFEHAFPNGQDGEIRVAFFQHDLAYELIVADNGIGIPPEALEGRASSLGLKVVEALVHQVDGELHFDRETGTSVTVRFKVKHPMTVESDRYV